MCLRTGRLSCYLWGAQRAGECGDKCSKRGQVPPRPYYPWPLFPSQNLPFPFEAFPRQYVSPNVRKLNVEVIIRGLIFSGLSSAPQESGSWTLKIRRFGVPSVLCSQTSIFAKYCAPRSASKAWEHTVAEHPEWNPADACTCDVPLFAPFFVVAFFGPVPFPTSHWTSYSERINHVLLL